MTLKSLISVEEPYLDDDIGRKEDPQPDRHVLARALGALLLLIPRLLNEGLGLLGWSIQSGPV